MEPLSASCEVLKTEDVGCRRQSFGSDPPSLRRIPEQRPASQVICPIRQANLSYVSLLAGISQVKRNCDYKHIL
jgi:hypothetical protein